MLGLQEAFPVGKDGVRVTRNAAAEHGVVRVFPGLAHHDRDEHDPRCPPSESTSWHRSRRSRDGSVGAEGDNYDRAETPLRAQLLEDHLPLDPLPTHCGLDVDAGHVRLEVRRIIEHHQSPTAVTWPAIRPPAPGNGKVVVGATGEGVAVVGGAVVRTGVEVAEVEVAGVGTAGVEAGDVGEVVGAAVLVGPTGLADRRSLTATGPDEPQAAKMKRGNATAAIEEALDRGVSSDAGGPSSATCTTIPPDRELEPVAHRRPSLLSWPLRTDMPCSPEVRVV